MNPENRGVAASAAAAVPLAQPPQPHRPSTSCLRHPEEHFTGFCPSCLYERLSVLETTVASSSSSSSSKKPPLSAAALKAIFKPSSSGVGNSHWVRPGLLPELRRTKSFSATKNEGFSGAFEPQRRSCDVRVRNTLSSLFSEDDERNSQKKTGGTGSFAGGVSSSGGGGGEIEVERRNSSVRTPVYEEKTESESEHEEEVDYCGILNEHRNQIEPVDEIVEEEEDEEVDKSPEEEPKQVKEHMEFNPQTVKKPNRDFKEIAGSFWSAASVFSKKLQKWRQKQKLKKHRNGHGGGSAALPVEKPIGRQLRDTQSEIADYGYGRRSCDTDPRFSVDAGRFSLDAGRFSLDAGRISVDAGRVSVDDPRYSFDEDTHVPVEEQPVMDENTPGGSAQTREYYSDSSSRRRKSLDRSSSVRKTAACVVAAEIDEVKTVSNAKVSPLHDRDPKDLYSRSQSQSNSLRDDCSVENFEVGFRENAGNVDNKKATKKSKRWSWNIFGLIHRKNGNKCEEEEEEDDTERFSSSRGRSRIERTFSGSWNGDARKGFDPRMMRSNSSVSWRSSAGGFRRSNADGGYLNGKKRADGNNGMLRFYLTPMSGSRRARGDANGKKSVMKFY
ncbi:PREDICTED: UPF0503 protein At3g09070, chloroplastic [Tarenaya hassleriana]|uniref:UPF0503 protein At3g09070, chloroplastic n=1 Tax=Tarenaya hassleriana TaxID=28532 RepID=UPI00053C140B|nr:PREDICTED: UPF0503 protein At3g09070, chloroplastic [Tarenaya hassleriana]